MSVAENIKDVEGAVARALKDAGRADDPQLVAVSKRQPDERIEEALAAGQRVFGENRVQEAQERWGSRDSGRRADIDDLRLHLIGPLQTNKAGDAVALFDVIETLDREKLARVLSHEMDKQGRKLPCYIQVNTGEEEQKSGIAPQDLPAFYALCCDDLGLDIVGLMCIPPVDEPAAVHFAFLQKLARELGLEGLSMGMSGDYEKAVALGATSVRVGTGVFGARSV